MSSNHKSWVLSNENFIFSTTQGKGELQTYWLEVRGEATSSTASSSDAVKVDPLVQEMAGQSEEEALVAANLRLADWATDILSRFLNLLVLTRQQNGNVDGISQTEACSKLEATWGSRQDWRVLDDVEDVIQLPQRVDNKAIESKEEALSISPIATSSSRST